MYAAANLEVASLRCATRKRVFVAAVSQPALAHEYVLDLVVGIDPRLDIDFQLRLGLNPRLVHGVVPDVVVVH